MLLHIVFLFFLFQSDHRLCALSEKCAQVFFIGFVIEAFHVIERFLLIRRIGAQKVIDLSGIQRADRALDSVQIDRCAEFKAAHIPDVGKIMLYTRRRPRHTGILHGRTAEHQAFKHGLYGAFVTLQKTVGMLDALI